LRTVRSGSPAETQALAERLGARVAPGDVLELRGPLGAGKTCFVQGLARGLGVPAEERVASPTFNIVIEHAGRIPLYHVDLYRIGEERELDEIGLDAYLSGEGVCAVEWLESFPARAPRERLTIALAFVEGEAEARGIEVTAHGGRAEKLLAEWLGG
jgi:tRNA threonylcarbamoyladenosine biosynthesis protein TsaE